MLTPAAYLDALTRDAATFSDLLASADVSAPVPGCPGWTIGDLARHLSGVHRWAHGVLVTGEPGDEPEGPQDADELRRWFTDGAEQLLAALNETDPSTPLWTFGPKPRTAEFWFRRQALETLVHLWDLQQALGQPLTIDDQLSRDGVDEVVTMFFPRQVRLGRTPALTNSLELVVSDASNATYRLSGDGTADGGDSSRAEVAISGSAADLLLVLWGRKDVWTVFVDGDPNLARAIVSVGLTP